HNGTTATGHTTPPHIPLTGIQCSNCHDNTAASFTAYTMNHTAGSGGRTAYCQNGSYTRCRTKVAMSTVSFAAHAPTKCPDRLPSHPTASILFTNAAGGAIFPLSPHATLPICHNGTTATGHTTPPHIPVTGIQCSNCHVNTAPSFTTYTMSHTAVSASRCDSCHNGSYTSQGTNGAQAKAAGHIPTGAADCTSCHASTVSFDSGGSATTCKMAHTVVTRLARPTPPHRRPSNGNSHHRPTS